MLPNTPLVAPLVIAWATAAGSAVGFAWRYNAAAPATCGEAIEVPLMVTAETSLKLYADRIDTPGANTSTQAP